MVESREVRRSSLLPDRIAADIMAKIQDGELMPGDPLPTEHALAGTFGVSRNVVREAIARLRSDGVIESRQGRGAVVKPVSERETFRVDIRSLEKSGNLADLFELRGLLEIEAAGLAALRRSAEDLSEMRAAVAVLEGHKQFDEQRLEADAVFHRAIGKAAGNSYLFAIICYISSRLKETTRVTSDIYTKDDLVEITLDEHRRVLAAIEAGDRTAARDAMATHVQGAASRLNVEVKLGTKV
ncbi:FadR/GntR family transcriptional regulator [Roseibium aggregatum]|uniref:Transcriptional regulator n=1 Tax=Roseibium aggregatum (strain ATCC 25650 / DSM 13394 / JCM 20685 / NBRC 16684 / NCIMB 2208 / IAM 12614 / B1) TaxID=384765 RepID=A0NRG2_ROSAI|nr:FadR/GntR family transcriptional regulator [Roseibium aggregatum]EAV44743.1 transcriptional regulator [Roseibium aggregatum IAM 12614]